MGGVNRFLSPPCMTVAVSNHCAKERSHALIAVHLKQNWDVGLGWERESCKYWQKSSSVLALVPQVASVLVLLCLTVVLLEFRAM